MARNKKHKIKYSREIQIMKDVNKEGMKNQSIGFTQIY
jgi:hypothetical protein